MSGLYCGRCRDMPSLTAALSASPFEFTPLLLLSEAAASFRMLYDGPIRRFESVASLREILEGLEGVAATGVPLVLDDLSFLSLGGQSVLLKFLEEVRFPVVLLGSQDNAGPALLSRIRWVLKEAPKLESSLSGIKAGMDALADIPEDAHPLERERAILSTCPVMNYFTYKIKNPALRERVLSLLGG